MRLPSRSRVRLSLPESAALPAPPIRRRYEQFMQCLPILDVISHAHRQQISQLMREMRDESAHYSLTGLYCFRIDTLDFALMRVCHPVLDFLPPRQHVSVRHVRASVTPRLGVMQVCELRPQYAMPHASCV